MTNVWYRGDDRLLSLVTPAWTFLPYSSFVTRSSSFTMWEAIERNKRRSWLLITLMGLILVGLGAVIGIAIDPISGPLFGSVAAVILWVVLMIIALTQGGRVLLMTAGAKKVQREDCPRLFNVVEEMTIASGLGTPPAVYILENDSPNAFAVGQNPKTASVAVTSGLLARLNRDELQGVVAHEIAHIKNLDVRFLTIAGVMVGSVVILSNFFLRMIFYGGARRRSGKGGGHPAMLIVGIVAAILAPIAARMLYFACSRSREYLADASAARFTRYPPGLASALEKISGKATASTEVNQALVPLYIVNPLQAHSGVAGLFSTHPPAAERIKILRSMGGKAGYVDYESAYREVRGRVVEGALGAGVLTSEEGKSVDAREASEEPKTKENSVERVREVSDILDRIAEFVFIACACGVRIKLPPEYKKKDVSCTRCGRTHDVPHAEEMAEIAALGATIRTSSALQDGSSILDAAVGTTGAATASPASSSVPPLRYTRNGEGWESFKCSCDKTIQLSPEFAGSAIMCSKCQREIEIVQVKGSDSEELASRGGPESRAVD